MGRLLQQLNSSQSYRCFGSPWPSAIALWRLGANGKTARQIRRGLDSLDSTLKLHSQGSIATYEPRNYHRRIIGGEESQRPTHTVTSTIAMPSQQTISREEKELLSSLGLGDLLSSDSTTSATTSTQSPLDAGGGEQDASTSSQMHPAVKAGLAIGFVANLGLLLSLPPVIMGKGAPYLPTFSRSSNVMWERIRQSSSIQARVKRGDRLTFVDLGSGDGRLVFQAARQNMFAKSIGYEINPVLHAFASARRVVQAPMYWNKTSFAMRDLFKVPLQNCDIVTVYGLQPIMKDLGKKLQAELRPGSLVVSNVFQIPGWRAEGASKDNVFIYSVPDCWDKGTGSTRQREQRRT